MGKKNRKKNKKVSPNGKPFVSVCTPTYNRRPFWELIKCFNHKIIQRKIEWIIIDDGDKIET